MEIPDIQIIGILAGIFFIFIAIIGGGFAVKELQIPKMPKWMRVLSFFMGLILVFFWPVFLNFVYLTFQHPQPLEPIPGTTSGSISISSFPSGASVYLDKGDYVGKTPITLTNIEKGSHTIILKLEGYDDWTQIILLSTEQTYSISPSLTPKTALTTMATPTLTATNTPTPAPTSTPITLTATNTPTPAPTSTPIILIATNTSTPTPTITPVLTNMTVSPAAASVVAGNTQSFTAAPKDQSGNSMTATVAWTSSDTNVGTIDSNGLFTAKAIGKTTITAASGTISGTATVTVTINMEFVMISAGGFDMGSYPTDVDSLNNERPVHHVTISKAFYLGKYEVTQKQWRDVMGTNPSYFTGDDLPVEQVSWDDVQLFINKLNEKEGTTKYRLPSEAEWEYAARAGTTTFFSFGDSYSNLGDYAWYYAISNGKTHPFGQKNPNAWGLYDMYGNVFEWVMDKWHDSYDGAPTDGSAWGIGGSTDLVIRGGGWNVDAKSCRSASRNFFNPTKRYYYLGFRMMRDL